MNRDIYSETSINKSNHLRIIFATVSLLLFFVGSLTTVYADDYHRSVTGFENREGYYYGDKGFSYGERGEKGNGATGVIAAFLLLTANLTVVLSLILKGVSRLFLINQESKKSIGDFNKAQKKCLRGLHYILNPIAICIAVIHFHLSTCSSMLPDAALLLFIVIGITGVIIKFKLFPKNLYKAVYSLHCSWIVFLSTFLLIMIGHAMI